MIPPFPQPVSRCRNGTRILSPAVIDTTDGKQPNVEAHAIYQGPPATNATALKGFEPAALVFFAGPIAVNGRNFIDVAGNCRRLPHCPLGWSIGSAESCISALNQTTGRYSSRHRGEQGSLG